MTGPMKRDLDQHIDVCLANAKTLELAQTRLDQSRADASLAIRLCNRQVLQVAAPAIVTGCRLSMGLTLVMAIVAEMIANPHGLGYAVISELQAMQPQRMFAYVIFIGVLSIALNAGLLWFSRHILRSHRWAHTDNA